MVRLWGLKAYAQVSGLHGLSSIALETQTLDLAGRECRVQALGFRV